MHLLVLFKFSHQLLTQGEEAGFFLAVYGQRLRQLDRTWIAMHAVNDKLIVQVSACHAAGRAQGADDLPLDRKSVV